MDVFAPQNGFERPLGLFMCWCDGSADVPAWGHPWGIAAAAVIDFKSGCCLEPKDCEYCEPTPIKSEVAREVTFFRGRFTPGCGEYLALFCSILALWEYAKKMDAMLSQAWVWGGSRPGWQHPRSPLWGARLIIYSDSQNLVDVMGPLRKWPTDKDGRHLQPLAAAAAAMLNRIAQQYELYGVTVQKSSVKVPAFKRAHVAAISTLRQYRDGWGTVMKHHSNLNPYQNIITAFERSEEILKAPR